MFRLEMEGRVIHRIVVDTNVLIAGLRSRSGASFRVLQLIGQERFELCLSVSLMLEYEQVLLRHKSELIVDEADIHTILDYFARVGKPVTVHFLWRPLLEDPDDDMLVELAVAGGARVIVTHNLRDFRGAGRLGIEALAPAEFLHRIGAP